MLYEKKKENEDPTRREIMKTKVFIKLIMTSCHGIESYSGHYELLVLQMLN